MKYDNEFWLAFDGLVARSELVIDRPKGSRHPRFPEIIYPLDYGFLKGTSAMDGDGIDVWRGTRDSFRVDSIICSLDLVKKDSEVKLLVGCTPEEIRIVYEFHNQRDFMKGILVPRE